MSQLFTSGGQSIGASASAPVLPMNTQGWFPLGLTGLISLPSKELPRIFSSTIRKYQFFSAQPSYRPTLTFVYNYWKNHSFDYVDLCRQNDVSAFKSVVIAFLRRSKHLLISWLQSSSAVILEARKSKFVTASTFSPSICHEVMGPDAMILVFSMLSMKPVFSLSSFTPIKWPL